MHSVGQPAVNCVSQSVDCSRGLIGGNETSVEFPEDKHGRAKGIDAKWVRTGTA